MTTPKLSMPELAVGQSGKEITHNQALAVLDQLTQCRVVDKDLSTPPGSPVDGAAYIVAATATGAWVGMENKIAYWRTSSGVWAFITPTSGMTAFVVDEWKQYYFDGSAWLSSLLIQTLAIACSDEATPLTVGTSKVTFRMPYAFTLQSVKASLTVSQASGAIFTVDINTGGSSILSTKLTIDNTETTSKTAATPAVISSASLADDAEITIDIDQVGSGSAAGLKVYLIGAM